MGYYFKLLGQNMGTYTGLNSPYQELTALISVSNLLKEIGMLIVLEKQSKGKEDQAEEINTLGEWL